MCCSCGAMAGAAAAAGALPCASQPGSNDEGQHAKGAGKGPVPGRAMWSRDDILRADAKPVSRKKAHEFLSAWRKRTQHTAEMEKDLTHCRGEFDWIGYLKNHGDIAAIVPDGRFVDAFSIVRLAVIDRNTDSGRVDFFVRWDDGSIVKLHPSQNQEARPTIVPPDRIEAFLVGEHSGRAAVRGTPIEVERGTHLALCSKAGAGKGTGKGSDDEGKGGGAAAAAGAADGKGHAKGTLQEATHFKVASEADLLMPSQVRRWLAERAELWPR